MLTEADKKKLLKLVYKDEDKLTPADKQLLSLLQSEDRVWKAHAKIRAILYGRNGDRKDNREQAALLFHSGREPWKGPGQGEDVVGYIKVGHQYDPLYTLHRGLWINNP